MKRQNLFIALEGIDGSGKSTQTRLLTERLTRSGHKVHSTFEPTNGPIGSMIRTIMMGQMKADHRTIAALFVADRLDHVLDEENGIAKKLDEGYTVITDRYYFSSYAYHGTHMDMDWVIEANAMTAKILRPDISIFIDVLPETSMQRLSARGTVELYETLNNLKNVRAKYFEAFEKLKDVERISVIDGNNSVEVISQKIWMEVSNNMQLAASLG